MRFAFAPLLIVALAGTAFPVLAQDTTTVVDAGNLPAALAPLISDLFYMGAFALLAWLANKYRVKWLLDIEANHRDALHSALRTAVGSAAAKFGPLTIDTHSTTAAYILNMVKSSVPDALKYFGVSDDWLLKAANAKLSEISGVQVPMVGAGQTPAT